MTSLKARRLALQKTVADAYRAHNHAWCTYVRPNAAEARMVMGAPAGKLSHKSHVRGSDAGATKTLAMAEAELLDRNTPTGAFEYGRAVMDHWDGIIRSARRELARIETEMRREQERAARLSDIQYLGQLRRLVAGTLKGEST